MRINKNQYTLKCSETQNTNDTNPLHLRHIALAFLTAFLFATHLPEAPLCTVPRHHNPERVAPLSTQALSDLCDGTPPIYQGLPSAPFYATTTLTGLHLGSRRGPVVRALLLSARACSCSCRRLAEWKNRTSNHCRISTSYGEE